ncbi:MAG TPA: hypothetical protein ENI61_04280, partial [Ignavibacteria bacterium]|nr:hypothetical protein [Ignavibacteria bacterium]
MKNNPYSGKSIRQLKKHLNCSMSSCSTKNKIKTAILINNKSNEDFLESFKGNYYFKLAMIEEKRKGHAEIYYKGQYKAYYYDFASLLLTMFAISNKISKFKGYID